MSLKITLKPHEKMIFGGALVTNGSNGSCDLIVENNVPILREKDIMNEEQANTPCKRIYFVIQLMYIDEKNIVTHHYSYWKLVGELLKAAPSLLGVVDLISENILGTKYYVALKLARKLIEYEEKVISNVFESTGNIRKYSKVRNVGS